MTVYSTRVIELIRWGTVVALERVQMTDPTALHPDKLLSLMIQACLSPYDAPCVKLVRHLLEHAIERVESGAMPLAELIRLMDESALFEAQPPEGAVVVLITPEEEAWMNEHMLGANGQPEIRGNEIAVFAGGMFHMLRILLFDDRDAWMACLSGGDGDRIGAYAALCAATLTGAALDQELIPPWITDEYLIRVIRAGRAGPDAMTRVMDSCLTELGFHETEAALPNGSGVWRPALAQRRREILLEEMGRRGWGDDPRAVSPDKLRDLAQAVRAHPDWENAK